MATFVSAAATLHFRSDFEISVVVYKYEGARIYCVKLPDIVNPQNTKTSTASLCIYFFTSLAIPNMASQRSFTKELLLLPAELLEMITVHAIIARGIKRGLRLRLVNSQFGFFSFYSRPSNTNKNRGYSRK